MPLRPSTKSKVVSLAQCKRFRRPHAFEVLSEVGGRGARKHYVFAVKTAASAAESEGKMADAESKASALEAKVSELEAKLNSGIGRAEPALS